ncbi:MAG: hypothetical protein ACO3LE_09965, partial [Bdellovibrionota bacterium]
MSNTTPPRRGRAFSAPPTPSATQSDPTKTGKKGERKVTQKPSGDLKRNILEQKNASQQAAASDPKLSTREATQKAQNALKSSTQTLNTALEDSEQRIEYTISLLKKNRRLISKRRPLLKKEELQQLQTLFSRSKDLSSSLKSQMLELKKLLEQLETLDIKQISTEALGINSSDLQNWLNLCVPLQRDSPPSIGELGLQLAKIEAIVIKIPIFDNLKPSEKLDQDTINTLNKLKTTLTQSLENSNKILNTITKLGESTSPSIKKEDIAKKLKKVTTRIEKATKLSNLA